MKKWNLIIDVASCSNCHNCTVATKDEYVGNAFPGYSLEQPERGHEWMSIDRYVRGNGSMVDVSYVPKTCNHCDNAPCIDAGNGAVTKREDGIVIIDPVKAKGRKDLLTACPYDAIWWNEELQVAQHWPFDAHLLDNGWTKPRCVQACPTGAMRSVKLSDEEMAIIVEKEGLQVLKPEEQTRPRVYYSGLEVVTRNFLGGNVATVVNGQVVNIEDALIELECEGLSGPLQTHTDGYGDFKFDGLVGDGEKFILRVKANSATTEERTGVLNGSLYLGVISLDEHQSD